MTDSKPAVDLNFAKWLQEFVDWLEEKFKTETEKRSQVYLDATEAYTQTHRLLSRAKIESLSNEEKDRISDLWRKADASVRDLDPDAHIRFWYKSQYWSDPGSWTDEKIKNAGLSLDEIDKIVQRIGKL